MAFVSEEMSARDKPSYVSIAKKQQYEILIDGYIRDIQRTLNSSTNTWIIPTEIIILCVNFYDPRSQIFIILNALESNNDNYTIFMTDTINKKKSNLAIYDLNNSTNLFSQNRDKWSLEGAAIAYKPNITLPKSIINKLSNAYSSKLLNIDLQQNYDVIFKCGGKTKPKQDYCSAILFDNAPFHHYVSSKRMVAFNWELPKLPTNMVGNVSIFADQYGLITIGSKTYKLSFISSAYHDQSKQWKWEKCKGGISWLYPSATMIDNERVFITGGYGNNETMIYDINKGKWKTLGSMHTTRGDAGIYFDRKEGDKVYVGGGNDFGVEYYDLNKNKWYKLDETNEMHKNYPVLWMSNDGNRILYIASSENLYKNKIEKLDLRDNKSKWMMETESFEMEIPNWINYESRLFSYSLW